MNIKDIIALSDIIAEMGNIKRAVQLPNKEHESDSHHSFSLALIAYQICKKECPELDIDKVVLFALTHDLLEIITGDEVTLYYTKEQFRQKAKREKAALKEFEQLFEKYPDLKTAFHEYEPLDTKEAATVFVLDKACTTWTQHAHHAENAKNMNIHTKQDVVGWADRQRAKINERLNIAPPQRILEIYEESFNALKELYST
jgi:5'-deoxynucleotidase YfbR-like HD superfamily hydrolase